MKNKMIIAAILILDGCSASGESLAERAIYAVPDEVSDKDARILISLGKAQAVDLDAVVESETKPDEVVVEESVVDEPVADEPVAGKSAGKNSK